MELRRNLLAACALAVCGLAATATAEAQPPAAAPPAPARTGSIAGTIRSALNQAPLARARVVATTSASQVPFVAITGSDGRYAIGDLPAGNYSVTASHTGFASDAYARRPPPGQISVADGQHVTGIDIALSPAGVIAGRILDEDGAPFAGAVVAALESRFEGGQHVLAEIATATTDDRGEFRIIGLEPGQYYVSASDPAFANVGSARGPIRYSPTYYPGTALADEARPLTVTAGSDAPRVEFRLRLVPPAWVSGRLGTSDGTQLLSAAVIMSPLDSDGSPVVPSENVTLLPDGEFTFAAVPPGHYVIRARGETEPSGPALFAHFDVIVGGTDVGNLQLTLRPGAVLDGDVVFETLGGAKPPPPATIRIRAPLTDGSGFGDALTGTVQPNRHYEIRGLMDGEHQIVVEGLAPPWVLKSVTLRGANITDEVIDAHEGQQFRNVRVTLTDRASDVAGRVKTGRDAPAIDAAVLVFPSAPQFWTRTNRRMRIARTDAAGQFSIYGLPPGQYLAVASYTLDEGDFGRRTVLEGLRAAATPFIIADAASHAALDLRLLSTIR